MVWYSFLFKNFPLFVVIYTVRGFGIVSEVEVDVFLVFSCFFDDPYKNYKVEKQSYRVEYTMHVT